MLCMTPIGTMLSALCQPCTLLCASEGRPGAPPPNPIPNPHSTALAHSTASLWRASAITAITIKMAPRGSPTCTAASTFKYGMPLFSAVWPEGGVFYVCGGGGSTSSGIKNR